ncbi:GDSL-type esterase/lipase family protein [Maioricimonas sp. JC845]|uniref:SGNH/GDSL hydrolase family protein n=1 Tax=Maioricimonas sp. JC845 TaxID=3232138 RepID=UPI00345A6B20
MLLRTLLILTALAGLSTPLPADDAQATRPKIVLVGDSIRLSYAPTVISELDGVATVFSPKANGQDSRNVLRHLDAWVIEQKPDVVHFNCGIHDTKKFHETGRFQVPPDQYAANLRAIVEQIRSRTDAVILFATTTPILDDRAAKARAGRDYALLNASVEQYNAIAREVMADLKVPIVDLNAVISNPPQPHTTGELIDADGVHMTAPARTLLGKDVAGAIREKLGMPEKP